jgi:predicted ATPase
LTPELLRVRATIAIAAGDESEGERYLSDALAMATKHRALAWRLRIATSFARLRLSQGHPVEAREILEKPVYKAITEGFETVDVRAAKKLLDDLVVDV